MNQLITITENNGNKAVAARELHTFLESKQQFSNWIEKRINEFDFVENEDYEVLNNSIKNPQGGRPAIEYALSIDMAKELSMVEKNAKGKQARRYFIAIEKKATQPQQVQLSPRQSRWAKHFELVDAIRANLVRGDVVDVANEQGFSRRTAENVMRGRTNNPAIINALFERAMANKKLAANPQDMINQLLN